MAALFLRAIRTTHNTAAITPIATTAINTYMTVLSLVEEVDCTALVVSVGVADSVVA